MADYQTHFDKIASLERSARNRQQGFHEQITGILKGHIPEGRRVLEVGSATGELLAALKPARGLGLDISPKFTEKAQATHSKNKALEFRQQDILESAPEEQFDAIVLDYLTGYLADIQQAFENLQQCAHARTRLYINSLNFLWKPLFGMAESLGQINEQPPSNWLSKDDLVNLLELAGWEVLYARSEQLWPYQTPLLSGLCNRFLVRCPLVDQLGCTVFIVARPRVAPALEGDISCSVIVPARNEAGNIRPALERIPTLGKRTEVIFVEGNSKDDTWEVIQRECEAYDGPHMVSYCQQPGKGKWDAVREGFGRARGDILVIQDGDLTAPPEDLPKFYDAVANGTA
ncbi:MAG: glycosyltransferase, partial [Verrucomicrobiota bacterium]